MEEVCCTDSRVNSLGLLLRLRCSRVVAFLAVVLCLSLSCSIATFKTTYPTSGGITNPTKGNPHARVTIEEFSDFQCNYCKDAARTMDELIRRYPNDVKIVYRHLPFSFHSEARSASEAAIAAGKQGKFWAMHDLLFENQDYLGRDKYIELAGELGLDVHQFIYDLEDPLAKAIVGRDFRRARQLGIEGTPVFYVNGLVIRGAQSRQSFERIIERIAGDSFMISN